MEYESTRGSRTRVNGMQAIIRGLADDKGLYVPAAMPQPAWRLDDLTGKSYRSVARAVIGTFFDELTEEELTACIRGAYEEKFDASDVVPLRAAGGAYFLELYHGKTAAFKDIALSILPYLMTTALKKEGVTDRICILTATSGDTGKAALEGFRDVPGTEIIVFFPNHAVSAVQERQMVSQTGHNTHVYALNGNFDEAQSGVKAIFHDAAFAAELARCGVRLSSANSINIGRLVPQIAYYVYGYAKLVERGVRQPGEPVNIAVPTGNFGNILAAYFARALGVPVGRFICASNENRVLTDFFRTGVYDARRTFFVTNSPSMDILISSNLERLLYLMAGRDDGLIRDLMQRLERDRVYEVPAAMRRAMDCFYAGWCDQAQTEETIGKLYGEEGYLLDTHTAVAYRVYRDYVTESGDRTPTLIAATASPYKFAESVGRALGLPEAADGFAAVRALERFTGLAVPACLRDLDRLPIRHRDVCEVGGQAAAVRQALGLACGG